MPVLELNSDQRRELINTHQRFQAWREAVTREYGYRGSMVWDESKGQEYLLRAFYDEHGKRRQKSLGRRSPQTEAVKQTFDLERLNAAEGRKNLDTVLTRQAGVNRSLGLGRVPLIAARILRLLDRRGLLGGGIRVVGTNALYAYEAACGILLDASTTTTEDIDLLFDARRRLHLIGDPELADDSLIQLLRLADRSFTKMRQSFRAQNAEGYLVDLIKPVPRPPWRMDRMKLGTADDIEAAEIEGLVWLENAPDFEQMAIDEKGAPLWIVAPDPRVFAIHKLWISRRDDRNSLKKVRDREQAFAVAAMTHLHLPHLPFDPSELRMMPRDIVDSALAEFQAAA